MPLLTDADGRLDNTVDRPVYGIGVFCFIPQQDHVEELENTKSKGEEEATVYGG